MSYLYSVDDAGPEHFSQWPPYAQSWAGPQLHQALPDPAMPPASRAQVSLGPRLIKREDQPPSYTLYVHIPLGGEAPARAMTGIFIPARYRPQSSIDLIVYLHGYKNTYSPKTTIEGYWNKRYLPHFPLREGLNDSGKNVLLVAPTLGPKSQPGSLTRPGGFDRYLDQVLTALKQHGPYAAGSSPGLGNIILACHSGGGWPMRQLAMPRAAQQYSSHIRECWGFDCLYNRGDETAWADWGRSHPDAKLYVYYLGSTAAKSRALQQKNVSNVLVARSTAAGHNYVPITHWKTRVQGAAFLQDV